MHIKFTTKNREAPDTPNQSDLPMYNRKCLGITIDQNLRLARPSSKIKIKLSTVIFALRSIREITEKGITMVAYHALFFSLEIWYSGMGSSKRNRNKKISHTAEKSHRNGLVYTIH